MTTATAHTHLDNRTKARAVKHLKAAGRSMADAFHDRLVEIAADPSAAFVAHTPNARTRAAIVESERGGLPSFTTVEALMAALHADD